jgi:hypothetical protein
MKRLINLFILQILTFVSFSQVRTASGDAIRKEITQKYVNGVIKQLTIAQLKASSIANGDSTTLYYVTDNGKKGYFELDKNDNSSTGNDSTIIVTNNGKRLKRTVEQYLSPSTTGKYYRGDKTWQTLDKSVIGLSSVDNTADLNKPISTATQTALLGKLDKGYSISELRSLSNSVLAATQIFYCNELEKEGFWKYDSSDNSSSDNLGTIIVTGGGKRLKRIYNGVLYSEWFGAIGDGISDDLISIQNALNIGTVILKNKTYYISNVLYIPTGRTLMGSDWHKDNISGTNIYIKNTIGRIEMNEKSKLSSISFVFPNQNWASFIQYSTTITVKSLCEITKINYLGGWKFIETKSGENCEKLSISECYGYPLSVGVDLKFCADIPRLSDIHFNPNSLRPILTEQQLLDVSSIAKQTNEAIKIGDVDDVHMNSIFCYAFKNFIHTYINSSSISGDFQLVNWGADIVNTAFLLERANSSFGIHVTNGFCTPLNYVNGSEQAIVKIVGNISGCCIKISNIYGMGYIPVSTETSNNKGVNYYFVNQSTGTANHILVSNYQLQTAKNSNYTGFSDANNSSCQLTNGIQPIINGGGFSRVYSENISLKKKSGLQTIFSILNQSGASVFESRTNDDNSNLILGVGAGSSMTTGGINTLLGTSAGTSITTGAINTIVGNQAGLLLSTGNYNSFLGVQAGRQTTTGEQNTYIGWEAGYNNINGVRNVAIGKSSAKFIADNITANTGSTNSVYIGANTKSYNSNQDQETVVGFDAVGDGSNTTVIGNINNKSIRLNGKIIIGSGSSVGTLNLSSGLGTITSTSITTNSIIWITTKTLSGTSAHDYTYNISAAGTATITARQSNGSTETGCNSTVQYWIIN